MTQHKNSGTHTPSADSPAAQAPRLPAQPIVPTVAVPKPQALSPEQAVALAAQQRTQGQLAQAEQLLKKVLQVQPQNHAAWHELAMVAHDVGKLELTAELMAQAIKHNNKIAVYHANIGEVYRILKQLDKAVSHGRKATELDPKLAYARSNLGIAYYDTKDYDKAETCHKMALKLAPNSAPSLNNMGSICRDRDDDAGAVEWYIRAIEADAQYLEPLNNLGATYLRMERHADALAMLDRAIRANPRYAEAICNKGYVLSSLEKYDDALRLFNAALQIRPAYAEAYIGLANIYREKLMLDEAEAAARRAIEYGANDEAEGWSTLGSIYTAQGRNDLAEPAYNKALSIDPDSTSAKRGIGHIRLEDGQIEEAQKIFAETIDNGRDRVSSLFSLIQSSKTKKGDDIIAQMEAEEKNIATMSDSKKIFLHFGLGKIYDDIGESDKAFPHFIEGCRLKRARIPYNPAQKEAHFKKIRDTFSVEFIATRSGKGFASDVPIFVVGMPRSGTTLTEQIISSHPDVFGAGEIFDFLDLAGSNNKDNAPGFPETVPFLKPEGFADIGRRYVEGLQKRAPDARRVTDKMPINFQHIGMIHLALPHAKIVHVSRHPLDTCISCFTRLFAHNQNCTYDLRELGLFYKGYHDTMQHWRRVLPAGSFYDLRYEDLVDDTQAQARQLLEFCQLEWDDRCLDFHKNDRSIRTASLTQVRQPIYRTSLDRWKKYEKFLSPLIDALGDAMPKA